MFFKFNLHYICKSIIQTTTKMKTQTTTTTTQIGDKIKSFTVVNIVESIKKDYNDDGSYKKVIAKYMLLQNDKGQQRVLELGRTNLNECLRIYVWTKFEFMDWGNLPIIK